MTTIPVHALRHDERAASLSTMRRVVRVGDMGARLLAGPPASRGRETLIEHVARLGDVAPGLSSADDLRAAIRESGLLGRGGAGFPTATKFDVAAASPGAAIVVVNASEGEPASRKDRTLLELRPHLVLDGAEAAASAVVASDVIIYTHRSHRKANVALHAALAERGTLRVRVRVVDAPETYIAGETSAVVSYLDGRGAVPRRGIVPAARTGVAGRPTVVNNVETLAHLALIVRYGASWFREVGSGQAPGSTLLTLSGSVGQPGLVVEVVGPATLGEILVAYGGWTRPPRAVLMGGYEGTWISGEEAWHVPVDRHRLSKLSTPLGCGLVAVLDSHVCGLSQTARLVTWLAGQSAGQCGPCVYGLPTLRDELNEIVAGRSRRGDLRRLHEMVGSLRGRGACGHPTGVVNMLESAFDAFSDDLRRHVRGEVCDDSGERGYFHLPASRGQP